MKSGVYTISDAQGRVYVGGSKNMDRREKGHFAKLRRRMHENYRLQDHVNAHGIDSLRFDVVEFCDIAELSDREQYYIDSLNSVFNIRRIAFSKEISEEQRKAHSDYMKLNPNRYWKGKKLSEEAKQKISSTRIKLIAEGKIKFDFIPTSVGYKHTEAHKKYISELLKGRVLSKETRLKISLARLGKKQSAEVKEKIRKTCIEKNIINNITHVGSRS